MNLMKMETKSRGNINMLKMYLENTVEGDLNTMKISSENIGEGGFECDENEFREHSGGGI